MKAKKASRLWYVDNLRIFLISLVVLHHLIITYGAPGGWYYNETEADFPAILFMAAFVATNQAFFMGLFFFISAYFAVPSLNRKGTKRFISERLMRLGIPLLFFFFILNPLTEFLRNHFIYQNGDSLGQLIFGGDAYGVGPMWFVEALILFTAFYLLGRSLNIKTRLTFPQSWKIVAFAIFTGIGQYIIRIWLPVGWSFSFTGFQFPHFLQYIFLFAFGIVAYQNNWLVQISKKIGLKWFGVAQILILLGFPLLFVLGGAGSGSIDKFMGGVTWQSFVYAIWEQLTGVSLILGLLGIFKGNFNQQGKTTMALSQSAYAVYIIHPPVIVGISAVFVSWDFPSLAKFCILAPIALATCFLLSYMVKQLPILKNIL